MVGVPCVAPAPRPNPTAMRFLLGALAATVAAAAAASASPPPVPAMEAATLAYIAQMQRAVLRRDFGTIAVRDVAAAAWASFTGE